MRSLKTKWFTINVLTNVTRIDEDVVIPIEVLTNRYISDTSVFDSWLQSRKPDEFVESIRINEDKPLIIVVEGSPVRARIVEGVDQFMYRRVYGYKDIKANVYYVKNSESVLDLKRYYIKFKQRS